MAKNAKITISNPNSKFQKAKLSFWYNKTFCEEKWTSPVQKSKVVVKNQNLYTMFKVLNAVRNLWIFYSLQFYTKTPQTLQTLTNQ